MIRTTIGDFEVTVLSDGTYELDGGAFFGVVPKVLWEKRVQPDARNMLKVGTNCLLVRDGKQTVLIETGIGSKLSEKQQSIHKNQVQLMKSFEEAGVAPDEIDIVINTHLHFDHSGWNTYYRDGKAAATFPRAKYYVQAGEVAHAHEQHERDRVSYMTDNYDPLIESGQMTLLEGDTEIAPGISARVFPGHTRDMQAVLVRSGGATLCYPSDLIPTTNHLDPTWVLGYDLYPLTTIDNRHKFYAEAIPGRWLLGFTHDHEKPLAYVEMGEKGKPVAKAVNSG
jgi:glyoxylase-like metal-dependent hydrolase (beta-lactamase superfamily II)